MCGLVGAIGNLTGTHEKTVEMMLVFDYVRGKDSTGLASVPRIGEGYIIAKSVGDPFKLIETIPYEKIMRRGNQALIGHNRWATQGGVNHKNAHPYEFDSLIGAHNGTLQNKHNLVDSKDFVVDSMNLYHHIDKEGLASALEVMQGAWALTWWDKYENEMKFLRNSERPLFLTKSDDGALFWASESWMLNVALHKNNVKHGDIWELPEDQLFSFYVDDKWKIDKPRVVEAKQKKANYVYTGNANACGWTGQQNHKSVSNASNNTSSTNASNVTSIDSKKAGGASKQMAIQSAFQYQPSREVSLKVLNKAKSEDGQDYYHVYDPLHADHDLRLYIKRDDICDLSNHWIYAKMHQYAFSVKGKVFWKVDHGSVRLQSKIIQQLIETTKNESKKSQEKEVVKDVDTNIPDEPTFLDNKGKYITRADWYTKHGTCANCTGFVDPDQEFRWTTEGETICHECAKDPELTTYVNLR